MWTRYAASPEESPFPVAMVPETVRDRAAMLLLAIVTGHVALAT
jgi:hypothetical protein